MKKKLTLAFYVFLLAACSKNPPSAVKPTEAPKQAKVLTSVSLSDTTDHTLRMDSFEYDANHRLQRAVLFSIDSSTTSGRLSIFYYTFGYNGNDSLPSMISSPTDTHILQYNDKRMIVKDSVPNLYTYYFSYGADTLFTKMLLSPQIGSYMDTIVLNNSNLASRNYWFFMPYGTQHSIFSQSPSAAANPLYGFKNINLLLYCLMGKNNDYISAFLPYQYTVNENLLYSANWNLSEGVATGGIESFSSLAQGHQVFVEYRYR